MNQVISSPEPDGLDVYVDDQGTHRVLAKLPPLPSKLAAFPRAAEFVPIVPRSEWVDIDRRSRFPWILDQSQHSSCVGNGTAGACRRARALAGCEDVALSPAFIYSLINGNRDAGANISDACEAMRTKGTCRFSIVGQDPVFYNKMPAEAKTDALRFTISEAYHARTFEEMASGVQLGFMVVYGMMVGQRFEQFDKYGVAGHTNGPGNHCMMADGMKKLPDGRWVFDNANSWDLSFGDKGRCFLDEEHFAHVDPDAYLIRAVNSDPNNPPPSA